MKINKKDLLEKLEAVQPGVSNKEIIEFSNTFSFTGKELITFNDEISVRCPFESDIIGTVVADQFFKIVSKIGSDKEGDINLKENGNELLIKGKRVESGVVYDPEGALPLDELELKDTWYKLPKDFIEGIKLSAFCCSNDAVRPLLMCINITKNQLQSADPQRVFRYNLDSKMKKEFLLPAAYVSVISKYKISKYTISGDWAHFTTKDNIVVSCRIYQEETFPDIDQFFSDEGNEFIFPKQTKDVLEKALIFCDGDAPLEHFALIDIKSEKLIISSKGSAGWLKETIPHKSQIEFSFDVNIHFLIDILKSTNTCIINEYKKNPQLIYFKSDKWEHSISILAGN